MADLTPKCKLVEYLVNLLISSVYEILNLALNSQFTQYLFFIGVKVTGARRPDGVSDHFDASNFL